MKSGFRSSPTYPPNHQEHVGEKASVREVVLHRRESPTPVSLCTQD